ncbi:Resistance-Nodulation-Cell Division (RND) Superfamily [Thraustotheca clavata]|uniref:Resistance-Nodulation-Cell Division (RND) Superfamily n=1 Tax=Thraustotheca clavata TaxID=74557 RepID=A0A1V9ZMJ5_9STRA|nr:Resistance-Nodulation-Cell Division (RND) Superfamily [Thraustotheca clavata]
MAFRSPRRSGGNVRSPLQSILYGMGSLCGSRPWTVLLVAVGLSILGSLGALSMTIQNEPQKLWVAPTSKSATQQRFFDDHFGPFFRIEQLIFHLPNGSDNDIITKDFLTEIGHLQHQIEMTNATLGNSSISLNDLCFHPISGKGCLVESPLQYWRNDIKILHTDPDIKLTIACQTTHPDLKSFSPCMDQNGIPVMKDVVFGGITADSCHKNPDPCGEPTPSATALIVTFLLNNDMDPVFQAKAKAWEEQVFLGLSQNYKSKVGLTVKIMAQRSIEDALTVETKQNAFVVVLSYALMFLYVAIALGQPRDPVRSRFVLGLWGILVVVASMGIAFGTAVAILRIDITMITLEVVPFLILAIGVDNMFILTNEFDRLTRSQTHISREFTTLPQLMGDAMANVGPSITVAAISECLAFLVGALTRIPALESFCIVAAIAVLADYLLQITWFAAALAIDARRVRARRYDLFPWIKKPYVLSPDKNRQIRAYSDDFEDPAALSWSIQSFIDQKWVPFIFRPRVKASLLVLWLAWLGWSSYSISQVPMGLEQTLALPKDYYLHAYFEAQDKYGDAGPPAYIVLRDVNFTDAQVQQDTMHLVDNLSLLQKFIGTSIASWLNTFNQWRQLRQFLADKKEQELSDCPDQPLLPFPFETNKAGNTTPIELYFQLVQNFTRIPIESQCCQSYGMCGAQYAMDIDFHLSQDGIANGISASRMRFQVTPMTNQSMFINSFYYLTTFSTKWSESIEPLDGSNEPAAFPYSLYFVYYDQYLTIQGIAFQSVLLALGVVFVSTSLLMPQQLKTSLIITISVLSMTISLIGVVHLWNLCTSIHTSINAVSVVNLVACVGLGVEFCIHVTSTFASLSLSSSKQERAKVALSLVGPSIVSGITLTKVCGIGVLAFARSELFQVYFFRMYLSIVILGALHGLAIVPILLSFFGSKRNPIIRSSSQTDFMKGLLSDDSDDTE